MMVCGPPLAEERSGYVEGKLPREQIVNIKIVIENCRNQNMTLYNIMCLIDYVKAFHCVSHRKQ